MKLPNHFVSLGIKEIDRKKFSKVQNNFGFNKPQGGLWCSPLELDSDYKTDWQRFCADNKWNDKIAYGVIFTIKRNAKVLVINSQLDLIKAVEKYGSTKQPFGLSIKMFEACPDFENISKHYDMMYLTYKGLYDTHLPMHNFEYNLYGWDVSSAVLFNLDCIESSMSIKLNKIKGRD